MTSAVIAVVGIMSAFWQQLGPVRSAVAKLITGDQIEIKISSARSLFARVPEDSGGGSTTDARGLIEAVIVKSGAGEVNNCGAELLLSGRLAIRNGAQGKGATLRFSMPSVQIAQRKVLLEFDVPSSAYSETGTPGEVRIVCDDYVSNEVKVKFEHPAEGKIFNY